MDHEPIPTTAAVARVIADAIADAGISQGQAAHCAGIAQATMSRRMTGRSSFALCEISALAEVVGVPVADLLSRAERGCTPEAVAS